ncbi:bifunctional hydroxymethylpyrimidine kinase/phosphomethylpyrimidine kinase [Lentilactobacillus raoultii]|nr:bifunctional hydroxymethylpyrimidine kinase/phosphomethylpyrimidine kinase [Lentilactobacillus raoultii]
MISESSILVAEDFSAVGRMSMTAAISILSGFGIQTAAIPTEILSTQTEGFGQPVISNSTEWIKKTINHWQTIPDLKLTSALVGYVGNTDTVTELTNYLKAGQMTQIVIDPVLGDCGTLYNGFDDTYLKAVKKMMTTATVITPNVTELGLLTGVKLVPDSSDADIQAALAVLNQELPNHPQAVVTGIHRDAGMGSGFNHQGKLVWSGSPFIPGHFYGTGDLFAALICGYLNFNIEFESAVQRAVFGTYEAVSKTAQLAVEQRKYGLNLTKTLSDVTKFTLGQKRGEF